MIDWGAYMDGEVYGGTGTAPWSATTLGLFEQHAGRKVTMIHYGQPFGSMDLNALRLTAQHGATPVVDIGLPSGATLTEVVDGIYDAKIDTMAASLAAYGQRAILRPWWEMNGGWFAWGRSGAYVAAWQRLHGHIKAQAPLTEFCWCPNVMWDAASGEFGRYWPGNAYVDWVGMDGYNHGTNPLQGGGWLMPGQLFNPTMERLKSLATAGQPFMLAETASTEIGGDKARWIQALLSHWLPKHRRVTALLWFNWNIQKGTGRMDWPIESSPAAQAAFAHAINGGYYH